MKDLQKILEVDEVRLEVITDMLFSGIIISESELSIEVSDKDMKAIDKLKKKKRNVIENEEGVLEFEKPSVEDARLLSLYAEIQEKEILKENNEVLKSNEIQKLVDFIKAVLLHVKASKEWKDKAFLFVYHSYYSNYKYHKGDTEEEKIRRFCGYHFKDMNYKVHGVELIK
ncbi:MAG: hypothetical protein ACRBFS_22940 [Aureispira sp.]